MAEPREPRRHRICPVRERAGTRQPKPGPEGGRLAESGSFDSCGHYRKGGDPRADRAAEIASRVAKSFGSIDECEVRANIRGTSRIEPG